MTDIGKKLRGAALALGLLLLASAPRASERAMGVSELARSSELAVVARVVSMESKRQRVGERELPFIAFRLAVETVIAGTAPAELELLVPGDLGPEAAVSADLPLLAPGMEVVLFLRPEPRWGDGKGYRLAGGAAAVCPVLRPEGEAPLAAAPTATPAGESGRALVRLSDLAEQVRVARENQARSQAR